jgi:hypothetical protein
MGREEQTASGPSAAAAEAMRLKIRCPACACRYAVIGAASSARPVATTPRTDVQPVDRRHSQRP